MYSGFNQAKVGNLPQNGVKQPSVSGYNIEIFCNRLGNGIEDSNLSSTYSAKES